MLEIIVSILLVFLVSLFYFAWIKPAKAMKNYAKLLRSQGFKIFEMPYIPLKDHMFSST